MYTTIRIFKLLSCDNAVCIFMLFFLDVIFLKHTSKGYESIH